MEHFFRQLNCDGHISNTVSSRLPDSLVRIECGCCFSDFILFSFAHSTSHSSHAEATSVVDVDEESIRHFDFGTQLKNIIHSTDS